MASWKETMFDLMDGLNGFVWLFFVGIVLCMELLAFNLVLAKIQDGYMDQVEAAEAREQQEEDKQGDKRDSNGEPEPGPVSKDTVVGSPDRKSDDSELQSSNEEDKGNDNEKDIVKSMVSGLGLAQLQKIRRDMIVAFQKRFPDARAAQLPLPESFLAANGLDELLNLVRGDRKLHQHRMELTCRGPGIRHLSFSRSQSASKSRLISPSDSTTTKPPPLSRANSKRLIEARHRHVTIGYTVHQGGTHTHTPVFDFCPKVASVSSSELQRSSESIGEVNIIVEGRRDDQGPAIEDDITSPGVLGDTHTGDPIGETSIAAQSSDRNTLDRKILFGRSSRSREGGSTRGPDSKWAPRRDASPARRAIDFKRVVRMRRRRASAEREFLNLAEKESTEAPLIVNAYLSGMRLNRLRDDHLNGRPQWILRVASMVEQQWFTWFIMLCIVANTAVLAADQFRTPMSTVRILDGLNLFFTLVFTIEMVLKLIGMGMRAYLADAFNVLDAIVVVASLLELGSGAEGAASAFRAIRVLRIMKMLKHIRAMRALVLVVGDALVQTSWLMLLVWLFILMFAIAGVQLFSGRHRGDDPRARFDDIWASALTVFMMITGDAWVDVVWDLADATGDRTTPQLYSVVLMIVGSLIITNLFVAILLAQFDQGEGAKFKAETLRDRALTELRVLSDRRRVGAVVDGDKNVGLTVAAADQKRIVRLLFDENQSINHDEKKHVVAKQRELKRRKEKRRSGFVIDVPSVGLGQCMGSDSPVRRKVFDLVTHDWFDNVVLVLILANCVLLSMQDPHNAGDVSSRYYFAADLTFTVLFGLEMVSKVIAFGLIGSRHAYLSNPWDRVDGLVVLFMVLSFLPGLSFLKAFRALRPLRVVVRLEQPRVVLESLSEAVPAILYVALFCALLFLAFAIFMTNYFKGAMYACGAVDDESIAATIVNKDDCIAAGGEWQRFDSHFDNVGASLLTLFLAATTSDWSGIMYSCIDAVGIDKEPVRNHAPIWGLFFIIFIFITSFFALNLVIGVLIDTFTKLKVLNEGSAFLTESQRKWVRLRKVLASTRLGKRCSTRRMSKPRLAVYRVVGDPQDDGGRFEQFIMICILLNTLILAVTAYQEPQSVSASTSVLNGLFSSIFALEAVLKVYAWGWPHYWSDNWNKFDFTIAVLSLVGMAAGGGGSAGAVRTLRVFRVARSARLVKRFPSLAQLFKTLINTLPSIFNIGSVILLFIFMFAVLGRQLFGDIARSDSKFSERLNFETVPNAMLTLFIAMTGDAWEEQLYGAMKTKENCGGSLGHRNRCGNESSALYFVVYMMIMAYIMMELFLAAVLENFQDAKDDDDEAADALEVWRDAWQMADPKGTGWLPAHKAARIIMSAPKPLGCGGDTNMTAAEIMSKFRLLAIPLHRARLQLADFGYFYDIPLLRDPQIRARFHKDALTEEERSILKPAIDAYWRVDRKTAMDKKRRSYLGMSLGRNEDSTKGVIGSPQRGKGKAGLDNSGADTADKSPLSGGAGSPPTPGRKAMLRRTMSRNSMERSRTADRRESPVVTTQSQTPLADWVFGRAGSRMSDSHRTDASADAMRTRRGESSQTCQRWMCRFQPLLIRLAALQADLDLDANTSGSRENSTLGDEEAAMDLLIESDQNLRESTKTSTTFTLHDWAVANLFLPPQWSKYKAYAAIWRPRLSSAYADEEINPLKAPTLRHSASRLSPPHRRQTEAKSGAAGVEAEIKRLLLTAWSVPAWRRRLHQWWDSALQGKEEKATQSNESGTGGTTASLALDRKGKMPGDSKASEIHTEPQGQQHDTPDPPGVAPSLERKQSDQNRLMQLQRLRGAPNTKK